MTAGADLTPDERTPRPDLIWPDARTVGLVPWPTDNQDATLETDHG